MTAISRLDRRLLALLVLVLGLCLVIYARRSWHSPSAELRAIHLERQRNATADWQRGGRAGQPATSPQTSKNESRRKWARPARTIGNDSLGDAAPGAAGGDHAPFGVPPAGIPWAVIRSAIWLDSSTVVDEDYAWLIDVTRSETPGLEQRLLKDADDGRWDERSLLEAAAVAAGVRDAAALDWLRRRLETHVRDVSRRTAAETSPQKRLESIFRYLHREVLTGEYHLEATSPLEPLTRGRYNCVSATVWFCTLADRLGLPVEPLQSPTHAYCRVRIGGQTILVEATCAEWFDLQSPARESTPDFEFASDPADWERGPLISGPQIAGEASPYRESARPMTPVALVGTVYYNRGVEAVLQKEFSAAVADNVKAIYLDPGNRTARDNLLATLNNWAIAEAGDKNYPAASQRLRLAMRIDPGYGPLADNFAQLYSRWAMHLAQAEDASQAEAVIRQALRILPREKEFAKQRQFLEKLAIR